MIPIDQIYKRIQSQNYTWCEVYADKNLLHRVHRVSNNDKRFTSQGLIKGLKDFFNEMPGIYFILLKVKSTDKKNTIVRFDNVSVNVVDGTANQNEPIITGAFDPIEMEKRLTKQIEEKFKLQKEKEVLSYHIKHYQAKTAELDTAAGKVSFLLDAVLSRMLLKPTGNLQGTNQHTTMGQQPLFNDAIPIDTMTNDQKAMANAAQEILLTIMSPELMFQVAQKLQQDPKKVELIKMYL